MNSGKALDPTGANWNVLQIVWPALRATSAFEVSPWAYILGDVIFNVYWGEATDVFR